MERGKRHAAAGAHAAEGGTRRGCSTWWARRTGNVSFATIPSVGKWGWGVGGREGGKGGRREGCQGGKGGWVKILSVTLVVVALWSCFLLVVGEFHGVCRRRAPCRTPCRSCFFAPAMSFFGLAPATAMSFFGLVVTRPFLCFRWCVVRVGEGLGFTAGVQTEASRGRGAGVQREGWGPDGGGPGVGLGSRGWGPRGGDRGSGLGNLCNRLIGISSNRK